MYSGQTKYGGIEQLKLPDLLVLYRPLVCTAPRNSPARDFAAGGAAYAVFTIECRSRTLGSWRSCLLLSMFRDAISALVPPEIDLMTSGANLNRQRPTAPGRDGPRLRIWGPDITKMHRKRRAAFLVARLNSQQRSGCRLSAPRTRVTEMFSQLTRLSSARCAAPKTEHLIGLTQRQTWVMFRKACHLPGLPIERLAGSTQSLLLNSKQDDTKNHQSDKEVPTALQEIIRSKNPSVVRSLHCYESG
jgi:hypothetical protein